jgi:hypothetical protein
MADLMARMKSEIARFQREISALEKELTSRKEAMLAKLSELLGMGAAATAPARKKPGPKPGQKPRAKGARREARVDTAGRIHGVETLPEKIVKILRQSNRPLNAREIYDRLQKAGWRTISGSPQALVYKTLHRIEKVGTIARAERGKYTVSK